MKKEIRDIMDADQLRSVVAEPVVAAEPRRITLTVKIEIRQRFMAGETGDSLAKAFGLTFSQVRHITGRRRAPLTQEQKAELRRRFHQGEKIAVLRNDYHITETTIRNIGGHRKKPRALPATSEQGLPMSVIRSEAERLAILTELSKRIPTVNLMTRAIQNSMPTGGSCSVKACPFPAMVGSRCRQHFIDEHSDYSLNPSTFFAFVGL
jgi:Mor family transcriptional regulator